MIGSHCSQIFCGGCTDHIQSYACLTPLAGEHIFLRKILISNCDRFLLEKVAIQASPVEASNPSVDLAVYFESLCPDSIKCSSDLTFVLLLIETLFFRFVSQDLPSAWRLFGSDLRVSYKPFGKATVSDTDCSS